ncbi:CinA family protein [Arthrobacter sp. Br18]|uniref:CinA family protein n=1 Tax=Arthrobacter sp. Br18 TaxID=1312954 RepID=UPI000561D29B|nr:CinA family protein [Arthrobacter sp. Br18]
MTPDDVVAQVLRAGLTVATAESLTAGEVAAALAGVPGASGMLKGGVVAYSNVIKERVLAVDPLLLAEAGSVDAEVARQMAVGVRILMDTDLAVSTTGAAGPEPHDGKPVGTVFVAVASASGTRVEEFRFSGNRGEIRQQSCGAALKLLAAALSMGTKDAAG